MVELTEVYPCTYVGESFTFYDVCFILKYNRQNIFGTLVEIQKKNCVRNFILISDTITLILT